MNDVKEQVIGDGLTDPSEIQDAVTEAAKTYNITLTEDQMNKITSLMETISQYDYDVKALKETLDNLNGESGGFFSNLWDSITGFFGGDTVGGIINDTKDDILGSDVVTDSTLGGSDRKLPETPQKRPQRTPRPWTITPLKAQILRTAQNLPTEPQQTASDRALLLPTAVLPTILQLKMQIPERPTNIKNENDPY